MNLHHRTISVALALSLASVLPSSSLAFQQPHRHQNVEKGALSPTALHLDRRHFGRAVIGTIAGVGLVASQPQDANAQVFFDPAQYGDQELRVSAVDSTKEFVRRAILKKPSLAPSFYILALLDGLSFDAAKNAFGPDGSILKIVLSSKETDEYTKNLQEAGLVLVEAEKTLRKKNAISLPDAVALGGAEAIESIGGPVLSVQLGRADTNLKAPVNDKLPLDLFSGNRPNAEVIAAFQKSGMTEREMVALMSGLLTLQKVEKTRSSEDWKQSSKPKFREAGKLGRMSEFRKLTEEDIAQAELEADPDYEDPDDGLYISDSFGDKESRFGERIGKEDINEKTFNKYVKASLESKKNKQSLEEYGWVASLLLGDKIATGETWLSKYSSSNLAYLKDLGIAYNSVTQLGAVYTGGKYESLLKGRPRKSLNDDGLDLF